jgi:hypothetical protein
VDFNQFKPSWNPNVKVFEEFKHKIKIHKETFKWITSRRNPRS